MTKQTFTVGQVLTAAQMTSLQQTAMGGGSTTAKTASYVLVAADAGTVVQMNSASATTITVNQSLFAAGDEVNIQNVGAGVCTVTAGTATVSTAGSLALSQYEGGQLYFNTTSAALFFDIVQSSGMTNPMTTTGDIIYSSSGSTPARLGIGTTGQVVTVASGLPSWATPAGGGKVLQVIQGSTSTQASNSTATFADTNLTATITPTSATSKIMIFVAHSNCSKNTGSSSNQIDMRIMRGATNIGLFTSGQSYENSDKVLNTGVAFNFLDSPATAIATTYKTTFMNAVGSASVTCQESNKGISTITLMEIGA